MKQNSGLIYAFYGGGGIGLLFGIIMGTSITPTVATVLGALVAILSAVLGLNDSQFTHAKAVRIGSFGLACVLGAYIGLYVRSHNLLSPSLASLKAQYLEIGYSEKQALQFITYKEFGFFDGPPVSQPKPDNDGDESSAGSAPAVSAGAQPVTIQLPASSAVAMQHSSLLFSAAVDLSGCEELAFTDESLPLEEILNNFELTGDYWETLAMEVSGKIAPDYQSLVLLAAKESVCVSPEDSAGQQQDCDALSASSSLDGFSQLNSVPYHSELWRNLLADVGKIEMPDTQKNQAVVIFKQALCSAD
jgi:hypothetical protein